MQLFTLEKVAFALEEGSQPNQLPHLSMDRAESISFLVVGDF